jgi:hypothetical protein
MKDIVKDKAKPEVKVEVAEISPNTQKILLLIST